MISEGVLREKGLRKRGISIPTLVIVAMFAKAGVCAEPSPRPSANPSSTPVATYSSCTLTDEDYTALASAMKGSLTREAVAKLPPEEMASLCKSRMFVHRVAEANEKHITMDKLADEFPDKSIIPQHASRYMTKAEYESGIRDLWLTIIARHATE